MHSTTPVSPPVSLDIRALRRDIVTHITTQRHRFQVNEPDVEDLAQSAMLTAVASLKTYCPERGDFRGWVFGIVHKVLCRHARDVMRYNARFSDAHHDSDAYAAPEPSPEQYVQRHEAQRELIHAAEKLDPKHCTVFTLHAIDDLAHADIGRALGMSETATQKCYQRTRNKLAECIENDLIDMPLVVMGCQDKSFAPRASPWSWVYRGTHYTGQIAALVVIGWLALTVETKGQPTHQELPNIPAKHAVVMVPEDKSPAGFPNETLTPQDKPADKRSSTPAPRIHVVQSTSKTTVGKGPFVPTVPSYNPPASPASYSYLGR